MKTIVVNSLRLLFVFAFLTANAQDSHNSDTDRKWYLPDHSALQFAGNIGLLSAGPGYSFLKDKVESEILYGFVPGYEDHTSIHILTVKTTWSPYNMELKNGYLLEPFKIGTGFSYSYGNQFYTTWPKRYPNKYYWWASSLRLIPYIGSSVSRKVGNSDTHIKRVQLYGELGSTDLDIVSKSSNASLSYWDILNIAFGTKLVF